MPLRISGIEAWITVGDKIPAKEYDIDVDEDGGVATCWINGEPGQVSCLCLRAHFIGLRMQMVVSEADQAAPLVDLLPQNDFSIPINKQHGD